MSIVVTGATGQLGRLVVQSLLERGIPAEEIIAIGRNIGNLAGLADRGVTVRRADYTDPASLVTAFGGAEKVLLISSSELGQRLDQHRNAVDAAVAAGVSLLAYTSIAHADSTRLLLAQDHRATESLIRASGLPFVLLRDSWYLENYTSQLPGALEKGVVLGAAGDGLISAAARADYAAAAAAVLAEQGHAGAVYELGGDDAFTMTEYAAEVSRLSGKPVVYKNLSVEEYEAMLTGFGLPPAAAAVYADSDAGVARGELHVTTGDLSRLIGRPTTSLTEAVAAALG